MSVRSDLEKRLEKAFAEHPRTKELSVEIIDESGYITLQGSVPSEEDRRTVGKIISQEEGVLEVANDIELEPDDQDRDVTHPVLPPRSP
jgi:osmotically-inducible protein OsmY